MPKIDFAAKGTDPNDEWSYDIPLSPDEVQEYAKWRLEEMREVEPYFQIEQFTCLNCSHAPKCKLLYDSYNTQGDCLASK